MFCNTILKLVLNLWFDFLFWTLYISGDSPERVKWRSKQNLDYAFLMMYAQSRGRFYVQLEDDIVTQPNYQGQAGYNCANDANLNI